MRSQPQFRVRNAADGRPALVGGPLHVIIGLGVAIATSLLPLCMFPMPDHDRADDFFPNLPDPAQTLLAVLLLAVSVRLTAAALHGAWSSTAEPSFEDVRHGPWAWLTWGVAVVALVLFRWFWPVLLAALLYLRWANRRAL